MTLGYEQVVVFTGKTLSHRNRLEAAGASYAGTRRCWEMRPRPTAAERAVQVQLANELAAAGLTVKFETRPVTGNLVT